MTVRIGFGVNFAAIGCLVPNSHPSVGCGRGSEDINVFVTGGWRVREGRLGALGRHLCLVVFCTMIAAAVTADENIRIDSVVGAFNHGAVIEIRGEGFDSKFPAEPVVWDDFEHGTAGEPIQSPTIGEYDRVSSNLIYTSTDPFSGSTSAYEYFDGSNWFNGVVANWIPHEAQNSFASMKVKFTSNTGTLAEPSSKLLRLNTWDPDATHGYPNFVIGMRGHSPSLEIITNIGAGWGDPGSETVGSVSEAEFDDPNGEWFSVSAWVRIGDVGVANGMAGREFNGSIIERNNIMTLLPWDGFHDYSGTRSAYFNGHMGLYESTSLEAVIDEIYADSTFSRVIARDPDGGFFAMQIPQDWSDTMITIIVNTSNYAEGTLLDLFVYDSDNNVSEPFVVVVGEDNSGDDPGAPGQPSDLVMYE